MSEEKMEVVASRRDIIVLEQRIAYNADGEVVYDVAHKPVKSRNGSGFVISYTEKMCDFLSEVRTGSVVRVFLYIAHHQNYGVDGVFGYRCTHKYLQKVLGLDKSTLWDALTFLKDRFLVHVGKFDGATEFMVNPAYVTMGSDKRARVKEWNERWRMTNLHKSDLAKRNAVLKNL